VKATTFQNILDGKIRRDPLPPWPGAARSREAPTPRGEESDAKDPNDFVGGYMEGWLDIVCLCG